MMLLLSQNLVEPDMARGNSAKDFFLFYLGVLTTNNFKLTVSSLPRHVRIVIKCFKGPSTKFDIFQNGELEKEKSPVTVTASEACPPKNYDVNL